MRKFLSKTMIFLGILSLVLGVLNTFGNNIIYAEDLELVGRDLGLEITPVNTRLFDLSRLNPGDTKESKITIRNNYIYGFQLYMRTERMSPIPEEGEADLFKQLKLTVYLGGTEIYSGDMMDFATTNISIGRFNPRDVKELKAVVHLPGLETGNEFQGSTVDVKWIFIAQADTPPEPKEPSEPPEPPEPPTTPITPLTTEIIPEEPEEIIDEGIPEDIPEEIIDEEVPVDVLEVDEEEEIEEEIPQDVPRMPKTGEISPIIFYGAGVLFLIIGVELGFKKKE